MLIQCQGSLDVCPKNLHNPELIPIDISINMIKGGLGVADSRIYEDIALRTDGDIYIGVVGPVRTGKSTFIKRFMETLVIPNIENDYRRERARDELPQSGSGRTIMTAEPKFVPEDAVEISLGEGAAFSVRLIDCVGYMADGALGQLEGEEERMVSTPWFDYEIPMTDAAEVGTRKVIAEHSTIGLVITTDGSVTDLPRESYVEAEERVVQELKALGKPFLLLLNTAYPASPQAQALRQSLSEQYDVTCLAINCQMMEEEDITNVLKGVLYEFPVQELDLYLPLWVDALPGTHSIKTELFETIRTEAEHMHRIRDVETVVAAMGAGSSISSAQITAIHLGSGIASAQLDLPRSMFYTTLSQQSGFQVQDDGDLLELLTDLSHVKQEYDKIASALAQVRATGYGIVTPDVEELVLEEPEIVRQGGRYGVRLRASAPSIHMILANIETEVSPIVGTEKQSEDMVSYLLQEFEGDPQKIWETNIFGKSFHELINEDLQSKLTRMPEDARSKLQETLQRIINEGSGGLICIIL